MTAIQVGGPGGETAPAELIVLEPVEIGVQSPRGGAFAQVNEGFHQVLQT